MSTILKIHQPCPRPQCNSSDAYTQYTSGFGYCHSCGQSSKWDTSVKETKSSSYHNSRPPTVKQFVPHRGLTADTLRFYKIVTNVNELTGEPFDSEFHYANGYKGRLWDKKEFYSKGDMKGHGLFGKELFPAGSAKAITITEGEYDAPSVYQMFASRYPAVSVRSANAAKEDCTTDYKYLDSFERIYLCFDNDDPGKKAVDEVAQLFPPGKIFIVKLQNYKDANEYLINGKSDEFIKLWWAAKAYKSEKFLTTTEDFRAALAGSKVEERYQYPFKTLQEMTLGPREHEVMLITAPEGVGKTEILRAMEFHLLKTSDVKIGIVHIEESPGRTLYGLAGYNLKVPAHIDHYGVTEDQALEELNKLQGGTNRINIFNHFGSENPDEILAHIRFMAQGLGCKFIFFDHISIAVSGLGSQKERELLDYFSTKLKTLTMELPFGLIMVSHVNDDNLTRGSRNISKAADIHLHLSRNITDPTTQNFTELMLKKNRPVSKAGPAGVVYFNESTFMLEDHSGGAGLLPTP